MPGTALTPAPSSIPSRGRFSFRLSLLELLGLLTLTAVLVWAVLLVPEKDHEDRFYLAVVSIATFFGLALSQGFGRKGIVASGCGAGIGSALAIGFFATSTWQSWHEGETNSWLTELSWSSLLAGIFLAGSAGTVFGWLYTLVQGQIQNGPRALTNSIYERPILSLCVVAFVVGPVATLWTIDRLYWGGGPSPLVRIQLPSVSLSLEGTDFLSPDGNTWLINVGDEPEGERLEDPFAAFTTNDQKDLGSFNYLQAFRVEGRALQKTHRFITDGGMPCLSPDGQQVAYYTPKSQLVVAEVSSGKVLDSLTFNQKPIRNDINWLPSGKIVICETEDQIDWISVWAFDGKQLRSDRRLHMMGEYPIAFAPDFEWMMEFIPNGSSTWVDCVVTRIADEQELRRVAMCFQPDSRSLGYMVSPNARWLSDGKALFDLTTGQQVLTQYNRFFGFTPNNLAIVLRKPYQSSPSEATQMTEPGVIRRHLAALPVWRYLTHYEFHEQIAFVDSATGNVISQLGSLKGSVAEVFVPKDGRTIAATVETEGRGTVFSCAYGQAGGMSTSSNLMIWRMPPKCQ
jgi:hypothetical protein